MFEELCGNWSAGNTALAMKAREISAAVTGLTPIEKRKYSLTRLLHSMAEGKPSGLEFEVSQEIEAKTGVAPRSGGVYVPTSLNPRASSLDTRSNSAGLYTVATEVREIIELLRNRCKVLQLGAQFLGGLHGNLQYPRQLTGTTGSWVSENPGSDVVVVNSTFGIVGMSPKTYMSTTAFSRQLLAQSTIDVENFVRSDMVANHAVAVDEAAIFGSGDNNQPLGILKTPSIGDVAMGASGGVPTSSKIVDLETVISTSNADVGNLKFITSPKIRGLLRCTPLLAGETNGQPLWENLSGAGPGVGSMHGYEAYVSNQVPQTLVKGGSGAVCHAIILADWTQCLVGEWGVLDVVVDPYALKKQGMIEVTSFQMVDIGIRQPASFAAIQDATLS